MVSTNITIFSDDPARGAEVDWIHTSLMWQHQDSILQGLLLKLWDGSIFCAYRLAFIDVFTGVLAPPPPRSHNKACCYKTGSLVCDGSYWVDHCPPHHTAVSAGMGRILWDSFFNKWCSFLNEWFALFFLWRTVTNQDPSLFGLLRSIGQNLWSFSSTYMY